MNQDLELSRMKARGGARKQATVNNWLFEQSHIIRNVINIIQPESIDDIIDNLMAESKKRFNRYPNIEALRYAKKTLESGGI